jgi:glycosyltransferase involved in cell wall biosynthesis
MISVIITCFNREDTIKRAIESVLNQTFQGFQIIVVDDASTDESVEVCKNIDDSRIQLIVHEKNKGQNAALNTGLKYVIHDTVAFLDSDDEWLEDCLELYENEFRRKPNIGFTYGQIEGGPIWKLEGEDKYADALSQGYISLMDTIAVKRKFIEQVGGFDVRYSICQDDDFCMKLAKICSFSVINKPVARTGISANSSMTLNHYKLAQGWEFFFNDYKNEILHNCGKAVWGRHLITLSFYFYNAEAFRRSFILQTKGILYLLFFNDTFIHKKQFFLIRYTKCWKKYLKTILNLV